MLEQQEDAQFMQRRKEGGLRFYLHWPWERLSMLGLMSLAFVMWALTGGHRRNPETDCDPRDPWGSTKRDMETAFLAIAIVLILAGVAFAFWYLGGWDGLILYFRRNPLRI